MPKVANSLFDLLGGKNYNPYSLMSAESSSTDVSSLAGLIKLVLLVCAVVALLGVGYFVFKTLTKSSEPMAVKEPKEKEYCSV